VKARTRLKKRSAIGKRKEEIAIIARDRRHRRDRKHRDSQSVPLTAPFERLCEVCFGFSDLGDVAR
jgi:hypothetical protein